MNDKSTSYSFEGISSGLNITGSSGTVTMGLISRDKLEPIAPPRFVPEPKLTLDQQVARAQSIVRVTIEAQASWDKKQIALSFRKLQHELAKTQLDALLSYMIRQKAEVLGIDLDKLKHGMNLQSESRLYRPNLV